MPNAENTSRCRTPRYCAMELMDCVNGLYQSRFIGNEEKTKITSMITEGMASEDFTELNVYITEQCPRAPADNPFYHRMKGILSEEANE